MCLICILTMTLTASAAELLDTSKTSTLTVEFRPDGVSASDVSFSAYLVADVDSTSRLTLTDDFDGLALDLSEPDNALWADAVTMVQSHVASEGISPASTAVTDKDGTAVFDGIPVGLYLITGQPFTSEAHDVYTPQAFLVMLPDRTAEGKWVYEVDSVPKYETSDELIDVSVTKRWDGDSERDRPESITVTLYCDDTEYETVTFGKTENWTYQWTALSAKHLWTVSELKVNGYTTSISSEGYSFTITNKAENHLPRTGIVWWPVPLLALAGAGSVAAGAASLLKGRRKDEE